MNFPPTVLLSDVLVLGFAAALCFAAALALGFQRSMVLVFLRCWYFYGAGISAAVLFHTLYRLHSDYSAMPTREE